MKYCANLKQLTCLFLSLSHALRESKKIFSAAHHLPVLFATLVQLAIAIPPKSGAVMLVLTCALCEKSASYAAEELFGRYFTCKQCHWLNLLNTSHSASFEKPDALASNKTAAPKNSEASAAQHENQNTCAFMRKQTA